MIIPTLSIVVPVYNVESYIFECLESIVTAFETNFPFEVICVNDGSTDESLSILNQFSQSYDNFRVISQKNAGYGRAINVGIQHAKGEFVAIVESDDVILPNVHQRIIEIFKKFPEVDFVKTPYQPWSPLNPRNVVSLPNPVSTIDNIIKSEDGILVSSDGKINQVVVNFKTDDSILHAPSIWSCIYRKSSILERNIEVIETPGASFQDTDFAFKCYLSGMKYIRVFEHFYLYRVSRFDASRHNRRWGEQFIDMMANTKQFLIDSDAFGSEEKAAFYAAFFLRFKWYFERVSPGLRFRVFSRAYAEFKEILDRPDLYVSVIRTLGSSGRDFLEFARGNYRHFIPPVSAPPGNAIKHSFRSGDEFAKFLKMSYWNTPLIRKLAGSNRESIRSRAVGLGLKPSLLMAKYYSRRIRREGK